MYEMLVKNIPLSAVKLHLCRKISERYNYFAKEYHFFSFVGVRSLRKAMRVHFFDNILVTFSDHNHY